VVAWRGLAGYIAVIGWYRFINVSEEPEEHFASIRKVD
jgi:hypothetical protein